MGDTNIQEVVKQKYGQAAKQVTEGGTASCGGGAELSCCDPITKNLYDEAEKSGLPADAVAASLGCGNPTALIDLQEGQTVLDLGSGGGIDVLLSARRVGPTGFVYGVDMTDEMLALAQQNKAQAGVTNVAFLKGRIEDIPLPAASVDVVISNCVINLAADKSLVLNDAFRVLRPGGRFAVADVVSDGPVPDELRRNMEAWVGCIAGALDTATYEQLLANAGFEDIARFRNEGLHAGPVVFYSSRISASKRNRANTLGVSIDAIRSALFSAFGERQVSTIYTPVDSYYRLVKTVEADSSMSAAMVSTAQTR